MADILTEGETYESPGTGKTASVTAAGGTEFTKLIDPAIGYRTRLNEFLYETGATAHTVYGMYPLDTVRCSSDASSGQQVVNVTELPQSTVDGSIVAASDWCVLCHEDGTYGAYKVSSISGFAITFGTNLSKKVRAGTFVWFLGAGATDHTDRAWTISASKDRVIRAPSAGLMTTLNTYEPILLYSANGTNAGILTAVDAVYVKTAA